MIPVLSMRGVTKTFGDRTALDIAHFELAPHSVTALIGPNGAGKTTLAKLITGLWAPTSASELTVLGEDLMSRRPSGARAGQVGLVGDSSQLYGTLTIRENLEYMARLFRVPKAERDASIDSALLACDLGDRASDRVWTLSTGLKQRANIARALVTSPELLVLDEPTSGLDPAAVHRVYDALLSLREIGVTILLSTHLMQEVHDLCDRVVFLNHGQIVADGPAHGLRDQAGDVVYSIRVDDGRLAATREQLAESGMNRISVRREGESISVTVFDCPNSAALDALGVPYSRRSPELSDAFVLLAGE